MTYLYAITGVLLLISLVRSRKKTLKALKISLRKFAYILPAFLTMLIFVSIVLFLVPDTTLLHYLGDNSRFASLVFASFLGSITFMPGFIVFPLCGILLEKGVGYMAIAAFTTSLMMVGVLTYPIERKYFGVKITIIRNTVSFFTAIAVALAIGICFGEVF